MEFMRSTSSIKLFQVVRTDILESLPMSKEKNRYILTFIDHFTKWVEKYAISEAIAKVVAQHFV
jgi:hypothetical protein